ncbi:MAG: SAM-dependent methyltransferase [Burkholderiales bacterium]|nr:SAM-dependent methyltransferase [Burkholderiales bacterium]
MTDEPTTAFTALFEQALAAGAFVKIVLGKPRAAAGDRVRVSARPVLLKGKAVVSFVHTHKTRDITKNLPAPDAVRQVRELLDTTFSHAHLFTTTEEVQLMVSKRGRQTLMRGKASASAAPAVHDREKHRFLDLERAFLTELGVTNAQHQLVPAMARKWKQINKFIEVLAGALESSALKSAARIEVVDFGSGKGYLTFAMHDHLRHTLGLPARVTGVELRDDMVALCSGAAQRLGLDGLHFEQGDVRSRALAPTDIMIALHACDTATDHAIHTGIRAGASIIMCSPCCHKELRPQLLSPHPLRPILKHGIHQAQEAEMLTDGLRALMLDACGYDTQVFEFIALEHTNKNKMILAVKREATGNADEAWRQVEEIKSYYGVREHCLETLLKQRSETPALA